MTKLLRKACFQNKCILQGEQWGYIRYKLNNIQYRQVGTNESLSVSTHTSVSPTRLSLLKEFDTSNIWSVYRSLAISKLSWHRQILCLSMINDVSGISDPKKIPYFIFFSEKNNILPTKSMPIICGSACFRLRYKPSPVSKYLIASALGVAISS